MLEEAPRLKPESKLPCFKLCEATGKYRTIRAVSEDQIIRAAKRILKSRVSQRPTLSSSNLVKDLMLLLYAEECREYFVCLFCDSQNRLISIKEMFKGTINSASVHPREIARECIELSAATVFLVHNHPSGKPEPSYSDIAITKQVQETLALIEVQVVDHIVVGAEGAFSFAEKDLL